MPASPSLLTRGRGLGLALLAALMVSSLVVVAPSAAAPTEPTEASRPSGGRCVGTLTLTFDDGPTPIWTALTLRVLDYLDAPGVFFMVGRNVDRHPGLAGAVSRAGYRIGNHTYDHDDLTTLGPAQIRSTLSRTRRALRRAGVAPTSLARLPFGRSSARVERVLRQDRWRKVGWNVSVHDKAPGPAPTADQIARRALSGLRPGRANVLLQHDNGPHVYATLFALLTIVPRARERGYCVVGLGGPGR